MKKIFVLIFVVFVSATCFSGEVTEKLLDAIEKVESNCNPKAIGDNGNAVGSFQIWKIYVDDVNRILGKKQFSYNDRYNRSKSRMMTRIYLEHYGKRYERLTGKVVTDEVYARIHNGGLNGWKKQSTIPYWNKVKKQLKGCKK